MRTTNTLRVDTGRVENSGSERLTPIAYGFVFSGGSKDTSGSTSNFTTTWNASLNRYEITISGHNYFYASYVTTVTSSGGTNVVLPTTSSVSGKLLVYLHNLSGTRVQGDFQFVTYKK